MTFDRLEKEVNTAESGLLITYKYQGYPLGSVFLSYTSEEASPIFREKSKNTERAVDRMKNLTMVDGFLLLAIAALAGLFAALTLFLKKRFRPKNTFRW